MKHFIKLSTVMLAISFLGLIVFSCSPERKLVKSFVYSSSPKSVLLIEPQHIYKINLKPQVFDTLKMKDSIYIDTLLNASAQLVDLLDDSLFIANYILGIEQELIKFGFKVFRDKNTTEFMEIDSNAYIVNIAQIEIEESFYIQRDDMSVYDMYYYHDHVLSIAYINSWIEISEINAEENHDVYFASGAIADDLQGEFSFDYFSGEIKYLYQVDTLKHTDLFGFAYTIGRTYAAYTFDLLLNKYLKDELPEEKLSGKYWRFNPELDALFYATDDKFVPLDN